LIKEFLIFLKCLKISFIETTLNFITFSTHIFNVYYPWYLEQLAFTKNYLKSITFIVFFSIKYYIFHLFDFFSLIVNFFMFLYKLITSINIKHFINLFIKKINKNWLMDIFKSITLINLKHFIHSFNKNFFIVIFKSTILPNINYFLKLSFVFFSKYWYILIDKLTKFYSSWYICTLEVLGKNLENKEYNFYPRFRKNRKPLLRLRIFKEVIPPVMEFVMIASQPTIKWRVDYRGYNIKWKNLKKNFWYAWITFSKFLSKNWHFVVTFFVFYPLIVYLSLWQLTVLKFIWLFIDNVFTYIYEIYIFPLSVKFLIIPIIRCVKFLWQIKILVTSLFWFYIITKPTFIFIKAMFLKLPYIITLYLNMHYFELWYWCQKGWHIGLKSYGWYPLVQKKYFIYKLFKLPFKLIAKKKAWFKAAYYFYKFYISMNFMLWWTIDSSGLFLLTISEIFSLIVL
jgi:hypothetical protein